MEHATHAHPRLGEMAPDFRLAAAGGGEIALSDYLGRKNLLLWFSKGLHCPFCRRNMARLSQAYAQFLALHAEVLQITHNTQEEAELYFRSYKLATPYLCDPDRQVHLRYGIPLEQQAIGAVAANIVTSCLMVTGDLLTLGQKSPYSIPVGATGRRSRSRGCGSPCPEHRALRYIAHCRRTSLGARAAAFRSHQRWRICRRRSFRQAVIVPRQRI
jgi:peroxiredoxin